MKMADSFRLFVMPMRTTAVNPSPQKTGRKSPPIFLNTVLMPCWKPWKSWYRKRQPLLTTAAASSKTCTMTFKSRRKKPLQLAGN